MDPRYVPAGPIVVCLESAAMVIRVGVQIPTMDVPKAGPGCSTISAATEIRAGVNPIMREWYTRNSQLAFKTLAAQEETEAKTV
jgi:hypothetical protein